MFRPDSKILGDYYPSMLDQAVSIESNSHKVNWGTPSEAEELLYDFEVAYEKYREEARLRSYRNLKLTGQICLLELEKLSLRGKKLQLKVERNLSSFQFASQRMLLNLRHQIQMTRLNTDYAFTNLYYKTRIAHLRVSSHPVVQTVRNSAPELAFLAGAGTATRMAIAAADQLDNGDIGKSTLAAAVGLACIAAPAIVGVFGRKKS